MTSTYGYTLTDTGTLTPCRVPSAGAAAMLRKTARVIAGIGDAMQVLLPVAAIILIAILGAASTANHTMPHTTVTTGHVVVCDRYLSHAAMVNAQQVGPATTPSFCTTTASGQ